MKNSEPIQFKCIYLAKQHDINIRKYKLGTIVLTNIKNVPKGKLKFKSWEIVLAFLINYK